MKFKEAFNRLHFTISKQNKPNKTDVEAFNEIILHLKKIEEQTIQDNLLFAKMYALVFNDFVNHYTDIDFAHKEINRILSEPYEIRIKYLQLSLKKLEYQNYFNQKKILDPFLKNKTASELEEIHNRYLNKLQNLNQNDFLKAGENWDLQSIKYNLENSINLSLQNFKNYV